MCCGVCLQTETAGGGVLHSGGRVTSGELPAAVAGCGGCGLCLLDPQTQGQWLHMVHIVRILLFEHDFQLFMENCSPKMTDLGHRHYQESSKSFGKQSQTSWFADVCFTQCSESDARSHAVDCCVRERHPMTKRL